jgi:poly(3-hydroxyalkanoate) synthetase
MSIGTSSIAYMEQLMNRCLKASPSWYMSDIRNDVPKHFSYHETNMTNLFNPTTIVPATSNRGYVPQSTISHNESFVSGIRKSGCRVPF